VSYARFDLLLLDFGVLDQVDAVARAQLTFNGYFLFIFANSLLALVLMTFVGNDRRCRK